MGKGLDGLDHQTKWFAFVDVFATYKQSVTDSGSNRTCVGRLVYLARMGCASDLSNPLF